MSRIRLDLVVFVAGLLAVGWIGVGYVASNPLASAVTLLIAACYVAGAWELLRYRQATATLSRAVAGLTEPPAKLDTWLDTLHPGLRGAVRARVEARASRCRRRSRLTWSACSCCSACSARCSGWSSR